MVSAPTSFMYLVQLMSYRNAQYMKDGYERTYIKRFRPALGSSATELSLEAHRPSCDNLHRP
jgi:hypothetical protein